MLIRCKCGRHTNFGLTCVHCQVDTTGLDTPLKKKKKGEEEEEIEEEIESFESWDHIVADDYDDD